MAAVTWGATHKSGRTGAREAAGQLGATMDGQAAENTDNSSLVCLWQLSSYVETGDANMRNVEAGVVAAEPL